MGRRQVLLLALGKSFETTPFYNHSHFVSMTGSFRDQVQLSLQNIARNYIGEGGSYSIHTHYRIHARNGSLDVNSWVHPSLLSLFLLTLIDLECTFNLWLNPQARPIIMKRTQMLLPTSIANTTNFYFEDLIDKCRKASLMIRRTQLIFIIVVDTINFWC